LVGSLRELGGRVGANINKVRMHYWDVAERAQLVFRPCPLAIKEKKDEA
jgi:hypothetical protein